MTKIEKIEETIYSKLDSFDDSNETDGYLGIPIKKIYVGEVWKYYGYNL